MSDIRRPEDGDHDGHGDGGDLPPFDPALRRALDHAPDHAALPDARTRDAIRKIAINAVAPSILAAPPAAVPASWWRRWLGMGGNSGAPGSRMRWNAALATVLVAGLVTVLWHREPVPEAQLDGEATVAAPAATPAPVAVPAPVPPPPTADSLPAPGEAAPVPPEQAARKAPPSTPAHENAAGTPPESASQKSDRRAANGRKPQPAAPLAQGASKSEAESAAPAGALPSEPATASAKLAEALPPPATVPAPMPAPAPAMAPAPSPAITLPSARYGAAAAAPDGARAASRAAAAAALAPALPLSSPSPVLERWTSLRFTSGAFSVRHAREDIEGLAALVDAVVRSATSAEPGLAAPVEARLALYQGNTLTGVLEIAGGEVRWTTPPSGEPPVTGAPPPQALRALRELLAREPAPGEPRR